MLDKGAKNCHIIDISRPNDTNIANKVIENITSYSDLNVDMARLFGMQEGNVKVIPVAIDPIKTVGLP